MENEKTFDKSQMLKGILEGCILEVIQREPAYGYGILQELKNIGFQEITEGTLYPLLLRLEKQGLISAELIKSQVGPKRKYYSITADGKEYLKSFWHVWDDVSGCVTKIKNDKE